MAAPANSIMPKPKSSTRSARSVSRCDLWMWSVIVRECPPAPRARHPQTPRDRLRESCRRPGVAALLDAREPGAGGRRALAVIGLDKRRRRPGAGGPDGEVGDRQPPTAGWGWAQPGCVTVSAT